MIWLPDAAINCPVDTLAGDGRRRALSQRRAPSQSIRAVVGVTGKPFSPLAARGSGQYYYCMPGGGAGGTGDGSAGNPWRGITHALAALDAANGTGNLAGSVLVVKDGVYDLQDASSESQAYVRLRLGTSGNSQYHFGITTETLNGAKIQATIDPVAAQANVDAGRAGGPAKDNVAFQMGFYDGANGGWQQDQPFYVHLNGLDIQGGMAHCLEIVGCRSTITEHCKVHGSGRQEGIKCHLYSNYSELRYNDIYDTGLLAVAELQTAQGVTWPQDINGIADTDWPNADGIDVTHCDYIRIHHNYLHDCATYACYIKKASHFGACYSNFAENCTFGFNNGQSTVTYDTIFVNNIAANMIGEGIGAYGSRRGKLLHNTVYNAGTVLYGAARFGQAPDNFAETKDPDDTAGRGNLLMTLKGNLLVTGSPSGTVTQSTGSAFQDWNSAANSLADYVSDGNLYDAINTPDRAFNFMGVTRATDFVGWKSWLAGLGHSEVDANSVAAIMQFESTNPADPLYLYPAAGSAAIAAGRPLPTGMPLDFDALVAVDFFGNARNAQTPTIGAIER